MPLCLPASPLGTPLGEGVYLTVYPLSRLNTDTISQGRVQLKNLVVSTSKNLGGGGSGQLLTSL